MKLDQHCINNPDKGCRLLGYFYFTPVYVTVQLFSENSDRRTERLKPVKK